MKKVKGFFARCKAREKRRPPFLKLLKFIYGVFLVPSHQKKTYYQLCQVIPLASVATPFKILQALVRE
jgi:hypothetical protein